MIAAVAAAFHFPDIVPLLGDFHILPVPDDLHYLVNIFHELTDNTDSGQINDFFFDIFQINFFLMTFVQNAGDGLDTTFYLLNWRI